jgi:hypothetical protein
MQAIGRFAGIVAFQIADTVSLVMQIVIIGQSCFNRNGSGGKTSTVPRDVAPPSRLAAL